MTATPRPRAVSSGAIGVAASALLLAAALLTHGGGIGSVRTVLACLAVLVLPGWLVGRLMDEADDALTRLVGGTVVTLATVAITSFCAFELGLSVGTAVVAVPLLVLVGAASLLGALRADVPRAPLWPVGVAVGLGALALLAAMATHLLLPSTPQEPAFSIEAATAIVSPSHINVTVTVARVKTEQPTQLSLYVGSPSAHTRPTPVAVVLTPSDETTAHLRARLPAGTPACGPRLQIRIVASNNAFLTPPATCVGT